jgi:predicted MPP superfamily phosphohydrolase
MRATTLPLAGLIAGAAGLGWSLVEARAFTLRHAQAPVLPPGSAPLRVLHLSDLHLVPRQRKKLEWVRSLAALEPDLVISTGDNLASLDAVPSVLSAYGELLARPGVFVLGSNDYYAPIMKNPARYLLPQTYGHRLTPGERLPTHELVAGLSSRGWLNLNNARGYLKLGSSVLEFVGVDDPHIGKDRYSLVSGPSDPSADLTVGVLHAPYRRTLDVMAADGASLLVAGHTHGGQLCVPFYGALTTNCDLDRRRARGLSRWSAEGSSTSDAYLHVSAGLGTSPYTPVRFACRPEATLLTLTARD